MIVISIINTNLNHAGSKAPADIIDILKDEYKDKITMETLDLTQNDNKNVILAKIKNLVLKFKFLHKLSSNKELKIVQYPIKPIQLLRFIPGNNSILFIHDLVGLRYLNPKEERKEIKYISKFKYVIVHNSCMKDYLTNKGIKQEKIYTLELFDYLINNDKYNKKLKPELVLDYVGNLVEKKCPFIYEIDKTYKFKLNLYGTEPERKIQNATYKGSFKPEELPEKLQGNFGLVWDGKCDESDEMVMYKNYTKYNNPHKLSCYIAGGLPVIVWEKAAIAKFVKKQNIGYTIRTLKDINKLDLSDYEAKSENVKKIREKVIKGYYTRNVITKVIKDSIN